MAPPKERSSRYWAGIVFAMAASWLFVGFLVTGDVLLMRIISGVLALMLTAFAGYRFSLAAALARDPRAVPRPVRSRRPRSQRAYALVLLAGAASFVVLAFSGV